MSGGTEKLLGIGLASLDQRETEVEIGLEHFGLGRDRLTIGGDGVIGLTECVVNETQIEPGGKVLRIVSDNFLQQRLSRSIVLLFDRAFA